MSKLMELRLAAHEIFEAALQAVNPTTAIKNALHLDASTLTICDAAFDFPPDTDVFGIAIGKAASAMAFGVESVFGDRLIDGIIAAPSRASYRWRYFEGGHPLPNAASLQAAQAAFHLLNLVDHERAVVMFLISGGGSAMLEWPISEEITLEDLRSANQTLVTCGASISEINAVRRAFSAVKGGRLAACAQNSQQVTLIVSDVPKGEEHNVASGPTILPPANAPIAAEVVEGYGLGDRLPPSIMRAIENPSPFEAAPRNRQADFVLLDNHTALEAAASAARDRGFTTEIVHDISDEQIDAGCEKLLRRVIDSRKSNAADVCLISGGEFACPVRGDGIGGRNSETALRLALAAEQDRECIGEFVALCAGTDGIDGNSIDAGAIVDGTTIERAREIGLDPRYFLSRSDSASFFDALGEAITTRPTGTNVRDLRILLTANRS
jgi:glycerate 2-kinase